MSNRLDTSFKIPDARVSFVWGRPASVPAPWRFGLVCVFRRGRANADKGYFIPAIGAKIYPRAYVFSVAGLLRWGAIFSFVVFFAGAGCLQAYLSRDPFNVIRYPDLVSPWRWDELIALRGRGMLAQAKNLHAKGRPVEAYRLLKAGLQRYPQDDEARFILAYIYLALGQRPRADALLFEGLARGMCDVRFIKDAIALLRDSDRPDRLIDFCRKARVRSRQDVEARNVLVETEALAALELGRPKDALGLIGDLSDAPPALLGRVRVQAYLALGDVEAALDATRIWISTAPSDPEALAMAVGLYRQAGRFADMDSQLAALRALAPTNPSFTAMGIVQNLIAGRDAQAEDAFEQAVFRFGSDVTLLESLARDLGKIHEFMMLDRLETVFNEHGFDPQLVWFSRLSAQLELSDWAGAQRSLALMEDSVNQLAPNIQIFRQTSEALVDYCLNGNPAAKSTVLDLLSRHPSKLKLYLDIFDRMASSARWDGAQDVLVLAEGAFPQSRQIQERRKVLEPALAALAAVAPENAPSKNPSATAEPAPSSDARVLLGLLSKTGEDPESALKTIEAVRRERPIWWKGEVVDEVERRELELILKIDDLPRLKLMTGLYLREEKAGRFDAIYNLAAAARQSGNKAAAQLLIGEILRRDPKNSAARALLKTSALPEAKERK